MREVKDVDFCRCCKIYIEQRVNQPRGRL